MPDGTIHYALIAFLAIALLVAAITDIRSRKIENRLVLAVAVVAPAFWWASGVSLWPGVAMQIGFALVVFAILYAIWSFGLIGGGDIKLLTAIALWTTPVPFLQMLMVMALAGGVLSIIFAILHFKRKRSDRIQVPYGVAITVGGLWMVANTMLTDVAATAAV
ncbi:peptidase [Altererythrobacter aurantiacus]|uniref:Peptidase n=2 Tax=Parapontixanthobacter aurantiacus TaxID=1463599 RepID=A0A844ZBJ4_9SPHN|nr:prepilin peptidase [Parapontixanthobacter aurantiacus]MXO84652.1 peptidase [Parapontixanthobacter aurantiacus]